MAQEERLPNILQVFKSEKEEPPDNAMYEAKISHYLSIFMLKNLETVAAIISEAQSELLGKVWKELFEDKKSRRELRKVNLLWWEAHGSHRMVDAEFYLEHWKANYAELAENWLDIRDNPDGINRISDRITMGIAGLLFVAEYDDIIFATLKYHQPTYRRLDQETDNPAREYRDTYGSLVEEIVEYASTLPLNAGINFLGELSGAYILSCPSGYIKSESTFSQVVRQNPTYSSEEQYTMVLLKYLCYYGSQELAMRASEMPLSYTQRPGEKWKYIVEIPGTR